MGNQQAAGENHFSTSRPRRSSLPRSFQTGQAKQLSFRDLLCGKCCEPKSGTELNQEMVMGEGLGAGVAMQGPSICQCQCDHCLDIQVVTMTLLTHQSVDRDQSPDNVYGPKGRSNSNNKSGIRAFSGGRSIVKNQSNGKIGSKNSSKFGSKV